VFTTSRLSQQQMRPSSLASIMGATVRDPHGYIGGVTVYITVLRDPHWILVNYCGISVGPPDGNPKVSETLHRIHIYVYVA